MEKARMLFGPSFLDNIGYQKTGFFDLFKHKISDFFAAKLDAIKSLFCFLNQDKEQPKLLAFLFLQTVLIEKSDPKTSQPKYLACLSGQMSMVRRLIIGPISKCSLKISHRHQRAFSTVGGVKRQLQSGTENKDLIIRFLLKIS